MKTISIAGNVGKDAEVRRTQDGTAVASWSVAVEDRTGREKATIWFDVSMWGARGEKLASYITKGTRVAVSGDLGTREYNGKTYLTVRADQVTLLGGGERRDEARRDDAYSPPPNAPAGDIDDVIPF
jgi:single-strand DNA-binding protein